MPHNNVFSNVLKKELMNHAGRQDSIRALEALLPLDPSDAAAFMAAIRANRDFWLNFMTAEVIDSADFLIVGGTPSLKQIQQLIAEQRIKLGLYDVHSQGLKHLFQRNAPKNTDAFRVYLHNLPDEGKRLLGNLSQMHGWEPQAEPNQANPAPVGREILTDAALGRIRISTKKRALENEFKEKLSNVSPFGINAHRQLINAFNALPEKKQNIILQKNNVRHLVNAKDIQTLEFYLGPQINDRLVIENNRLETFRAIHNSELAKILVNINPPLDITSVEVEFINQALFENVDADLENLNFSINLANTLKDILGIDDETFNRAFLVNPPVPDNENRVKKAIETQHTFNNVLLKEYNKDQIDDVNKKLVDILLRIPKEKEFTRPINEISEMFNESRNANEFVTKLVRTNKQLANLLKSELTPALFRDLKNIRRKSQISLPGGEVALKDIRTELKELKKIHEPIFKNTNKFQFILEAEPEDLYNPTLRGTASFNARAIKPEYETLAKECKSLLDRLARSKIILEGQLRSLPFEQHQMRAEIKKEKDAVEKQLKFYQDVHKKLTDDKGFINAVTNAIAAKSVYVFNQEGVVRTIHPRDQIPAGPLNAVGAEMEDMDFPKKDLPKIDELAVYEVTHNAGLPDQTVGRFTADTHYKSSLTLKGAEVVKRPGAKFEILSFPKINNAPASEEAKINFAMTMAAEILAHMDTPPTKDHPITLRGSSTKGEEVKYLWTALVFLGDNNTKMKFSADAIQVKSKAFNPKSEEGRLWGFNKNALHNDFTNSEIAKEKKIDFVAMVEDKFKHQKERAKVEAQVGNASRLFKSKLQQVTADANKKIEEEGPALSDGLEGP